MMTKRTPNNSWSLRPEKVSGRGIVIQLSLIPMSEPPSSVAQLRQRFRPWALFLDINAVSFPISLSDATYRIRQNINYFLPNYALVFLLVLFLSLVYHPLSLIVFLVIFAGWIYLYFSRSSDEPLVILNFEIGDKIVVGFLSLVTLGALFFTKVWANIIVSLVIGAVIVSVHGALRAPEEDAEGSPYGSLLSDAANPQGEYFRVWILPLMFLRAQYELLILMR